MSAISKEAWLAEVQPVVVAAQAIYRTHGIDVVARPVYESNCLRLTCEALNTSNVEVVMVREGYVVIGIAYADSWLLQCRNGTYRLKPKCDSTPAQLYELSLKMESVRLASERKRQEQVEALWTEEATDAAKRIAEVYALAGVEAKLELRYPNLCITVGCFASSTCFHVSDDGHVQMTTEWPGRGNSYVGSVDDNVKHMIQCLAEAAARRQQEGQPPLPRRSVRVIVE